MLYEALLKKLKNRRATNLKGAQGLTAIEVSFSFSDGSVYILLVCVLHHVNFLVLGPEGPEPILMNTKTLTNRGRIPPLAIRFS
jgi:hypothetical protein